jgi:hypothetical protein
MHAEKNCRRTQSDESFPSMIPLKFVYVLIILSILLMPLTKAGADNAVSICLGPNRMFVPYTPEEHITVTIGDSEQIPFFSQTESPRIVLEGLDSRKSYPVHIYTRGKVLDSWQLDFKKFRSNIIQIWRGPGHWHMQDACGGECSNTLKCP